MGGSLSLLATHDSSILLGAVAMVLTTPATIVALALSKRLLHGQSILRFALPVQPSDDVLHENHVADVDYRFAH